MNGRPMLTYVQFQSPSAESPPLTEVSRPQPVRSPKHLASPSPGWFVSMWLAGAPSQAGPRGFEASIFPEAWAGGRIQVRQDGREGGH